ALEARRVEEKTVRLGGPVERQLAHGSHQRATRLRTGLSAPHLDPSSFRRDAVEGARPIVPGQAIPALIDSPQRKAHRPLVEAEGDHFADSGTFREPLVDPIRSGS